MTTTLTIFGATGDLAARLLFPALYRLEAAEQLDGLRIAATAIEPWSTDRFGEHLCESIESDGPVDAAAADRLLGRFSYHQAELTADGLGALEPLMSDTNVHFLALPPSVFPVAAAAIATSTLTTTGVHRLVVEKPFGIDRASAATLNDALHEHWDESQIFRVDHFLGKDTVQNLSVMRFANRVIEPLLCGIHVDQVQITVAETLGVEGRYRYYDGIGALRDMLQNHLMQLFCLAAMEPPAIWDAEVLRDHKVEVLKSVRKPSADVATWAARGQYVDGTIDGAAVGAYRDEPGIAPESTTETFAALAFEIDNWRWQGVPFYLRSGKRMGAKVSEIAYRFRQPPTRLFHHTALASAEPNWLVFRLDQPEGIDLFVQTKTPGLELDAELGHLHADYGTAAESTTAYEQILRDVIDGDHMSFLRFDEVDEAWKLIDPVLAAWSTGRPADYASGSDGPTGQHALLAPDQSWRPLP